MLSSLLLHALVLILLLLFPGAFSAPAGLPRRAATPGEVPIPLEFRRQPEERPGPLLGDGGDRLQSDPRPPDAPPPENSEPYARGNNPNRFVAPPTQAPASPLEGPG
ncbi:MAG TPA: hypothetical protein VJV23_12545, partial [Candidatus Polarisedimenticolia bacterium]|nr:hypothetical protein [Candidatus Polarisedimenticolia bacterium]